MGRPPSNGGPSFRFNQSEIAEMEAILQAHNTAMPAREVLVSLAEKFSNSEERSGKIEVQMKQVWNWFQNRRYAIRAKAAKSPGKLNTTPMTRDDSVMVKGVPQAAQPHVASSATVRSLPQAPQHPTVPTSAVRTFSQAPQHPPAFSGRVADNSQMEYEAKSARDGAWYDVSTFLSHRGLETGNPEVLVRFAGFGAEEDEWVNVRKNVRQRSLPCESSECVAVLPADLILCFQEGKEQALYFDAHVLDAQRRRHDVRGCRCRFLVRYDHDQSEEIVALRKICRRPETDYRLHQLHAVNEPLSAKTVSTLRVYPPAEVQPKQQKVEPSLVQVPEKCQKVGSPVVPAAPPGGVPQNQHEVQPVEPVPPAPSALELQKAVTVPSVEDSVEPVVAASGSDEVQPELQKAPLVAPDLSATVVEPSQDQRKPEPDTPGEPHSETTQAVESKVQEELHHVQPEAMGAGIQQPEEGNVTNVEELPAEIVSGDKADLPLENADVGGGDMEVETAPTKDLPETEAGIQGTVDDGNVGTSNLPPENADGSGGDVEVEAPPTKDLQETVAGIQGNVDDGNVGISNLLPENADVGGGDMEVEAAPTKVVLETVAGIQGNVDDSKVGSSDLPPENAADMEEG